VKANFVKYFVAPKLHNYIANKQINANPSTGDYGSSNIKKLESIRDKEQGQEIPVD